MTEPNPQEYQEILHQLHADVFLERLRDYIDPDGDVPEKDASDLKDIVRRLLVEDASPSIDSEVIQKFLEDSEIRDDLLKATRNLMNSNRLK